MSSPAKRTWPDTGGTSPIMCLRIVLLPPPEPPRMPNTSPARMLNETSSRIAVPS